MSEQERIKLYEAILRQNPCIFSQLMHPSFAKHVVFEDTHRGNDEERVRWQTWNIMKFVDLMDWIWVFRCNLDPEQQDMLKYVAFPKWIGLPFTDGKCEVSSHILRPC